MNEVVFTETFLPGEFVAQIFVGAGGVPVVISYNVIDSTPTSLVLKPIGNHPGIEDDIITFTSKKGIPQTYRRSDYDKMFLDYLRNTERLAGAIMKADYTQKDLERQIATFKKISELWTEIRKKWTEEKA